jgi:hypothetical protein
VYLGKVIPALAVFEGVISCLIAEKAFHFRHMLNDGHVTDTVQQNASGCDDSILLFC